MNDSYRGHYLDNNINYKALMLSPCELYINVGKEATLRDKK